MRRSLLTIFLLSLVVFAAANFQPGEKLYFDISYGLIPAGKASLTIIEHTHRDSIPAYKITSEARTNSFFDNFYKVRDNIVSIWDRDSLVSHKFTKKLREGTYRQHRIHYYYPDQKLTIYLKQNRKTKEWKEKKMEIPERTQDVLSAFYWVRTRDFTVGDSLLVNVTVDGRSKVASIIVHRSETLDTIFGERECLVIEPKLVGETLFKQTGRIFVWLTNDPYKIPIKLESKVVFGHFRAVLENAEKVPYAKE